MTSAERGKFSRDFNAQSNETSNEMHSLQRCLSLTHADQEGTPSVSGISELCEVTEEPQTQILKHDLEIPSLAKITSIPLSSFPPRIQQLMVDRDKKISKVRQTTEIPTVTYIWPVIKVEMASRPFWDNFLKSLIPTSPNLTRHSSSPDVGIEDMKCPQAASVKQLAQEELDREKARSYRMIVKSCNSFVSRILKSLSNIMNKDDESMIPLPSISALGEQLESPLFKGHAMVIYNRQVYLLYVTKQEAMSSEREKHSHSVLVRTVIASLITCTAIHGMTQVPDPQLRKQCAVKQNIKCLTTLSTPTQQDETSNGTHVSSHRMTTTSQPKQCSPSTGKRQQFLNKTCQQVLSKEGLQKGNYKEAHQEKDHEIRKKFCIVKDVRVHLSQLSLAEHIEDSGKASVLKCKKTLPLEQVLPKRRKVTRAIGVISKKKKKVHSNQKCSTAEIMRRGRNHSVQLL